MKKERERNINVWLPLAPPPTGDLARNPGMCPDWDSNWSPFGSQAGVQSTEPQQPGQNPFFIHRPMSGDKPLHGPALSRPSQRSLQPQQMGNSPSMRVMTKMGCV